VIPRAATMAALFLASAAYGATAGADEAAPAGADETSTLFSAGVHALGEGRPGDAIANFEALGDRGVIDPVVSFDRGLAYAERVRGHSPIPGDLGRAALGFEEARALSRDATLTRDATRALASLRAEVARRRALAGEPVEVDPGVSLGRAIVALAPEDAWGGLAFGAAAVLTCALFVRWRATGRRVRIGSAIAGAVSGMALPGGLLLVLAARDERLHLREGIIVSDAARLADERHLALSGAAPLPEAARVTIEDVSGGWAYVRFGAERGWVPSPVVRPLVQHSQQMEQME
jgi:hypothetical protein